MSEIIDTLTKILSIEKTHDYCFDVKIDNDKGVLLVAYLDLLIKQKDKSELEETTRYNLTDIQEPEKTFIDFSELAKNDGLKIISQVCKNE